MAKKKNPGSGGTLRGTGKHTPAVGGGACPQKKRPDIEALFDACRQRREADSLRKAQADARLQSAALKLGRFKQNEDGHWEYRCPDCGERVELFLTVNGDVRAEIFGPRACQTALNIEQWLRGNGFES